MSLSFKKYLLFSLCLKYTLLNITEMTQKTKENSSMSNIFGLAPVTSLQTASASLNNKGRYQERRICDDPYTAAYESPFTADYAGPFFAADICKNRNRTVFYCPRRHDAHRFRMHHQRCHQADVAIRRHFDCHGSMSRYDMRCRWSAGVFSGGSNYKSWTNNPILNAISVCELPIVSLIPCGMIKEIYGFVKSVFVEIRLYFF